MEKEKNIGIIKWLLGVAISSFVAGFFALQYLNTKIDSRIRESIIAEGVIANKYDPKFLELSKGTSDNSKNIDLLTSSVEPLEPMPIGMIAFFPGGMSADNKWRFCDGSKLMTDEFADELSKVIPKQPDGGIVLPDLRERVVIGSVGSPSKIGVREGTALTIDTSGLYAGITHKDDQWFVRESVVPAWAYNGRILNGNGEGREGSIGEAVSVLGKINVPENGKIYPPSYALNCYIKVK